MQGAVRKREPSLLSSWERPGKNSCTCWKSTSITKATGRPLARQKLWQQRIAKRSPCILAGMQLARSGHIMERKNLNLCSASSPTFSRFFMAGSIRIQIQSRQLLWYERDSGVVGG